MTVTQTSLEAYAQITEQLNRLQADVYLAILMLGEACISDVAAYMDIERSTVSARMNALKNKGFIVFTSEKKSSRTNITSDHYRVATEQERNQPKPAQKAIPSEVSKAARILVSAKREKSIPKNQPLLFGVN